MCIGLSNGITLTGLTDLIMSEITHMDDDRNITSSLVEESEVSKYLGNKKVQRTAFNDWSEAVVGWKSVELALKTVNPNATTVKKKKVVERSTSDLHYGVGGSNSCDDYWSNSSASNDYKIAIRCIGDDFETFPIPPWKSNIEQGTYRYVPDNGSYRTLKFMYDDRKEWYTIRKKHPEKVSTAWHQTCKRMQREVKRQLKRDMNNTGKDSSSKCSSARSRRSSDFNSGDETSRSQTDRSEKHYNDRITEKPPKPESHHNHHFSVERTLYRKEPRARSTQSEGAVHQSKKTMNTIHESEPVTPVPQYSIPSGSQMFKSASDLFIENFSHKINALEDEMKKDAKWLRKNEGDVPKGQTGGNGGKAKNRDRSTHMNFKENLSPRLPLKTETLTSDIFSVRPMGNKDLRPLERTRSYKSNNPGGGDYLTQNGHVPPRNNSTFNHNTINYNSEMDRAINGYKTSAENTKQSLFNTLTGTKINTQQSRRGSKGFSTPATITICDNSSADTVQHDSHADMYRPVTVDKKAEKKTTIQNVPALLPEISGKRLEFTNVSHRLL